MSLWDSLLPQIVREHREHPRDFLRQPTIRRCLHPNQQDVAAAYLAILRDSPHVDLSRLVDPAHGSPLSCNGFARASPLSVQHAYYLHLMAEHFGDIRHLDIVEIGGGYGNLRRVAHQFGHVGGYTILDFPEMLEIQRTYLESTCPPTKYGIPAECAGRRSSLLVATFSVNEMPMEQRDALEPSYSEFGHLFFAYNREFDGVDNLEYFGSLARRLDGFDIRFVQDSPRMATFMIGKQ